MTINKNRTYSSDGGYAAGNKQKEYVPKSVAKKASLMLREQERQRLIEAAKRLDAQTRGAAAEGNNGFGMVNNRQTFPEVIAANRNAGAGNVQSGSAAPRNVRDILDQPESTWRSGSFNGVIDPRAKNEFLNNIGAGSSAPKSAEKPGVLQRYSDKSNVYKGHGGAASLFDEKPNNLKSSTASDFNKAKGAGIAEVAGDSESIRKLTEEIESIRAEGPTLTPRQKQLYDHSGIAEVAGDSEKIREQAEAIKDFWERPGTFSTPKEREKIKKGEKILNKPKYNEEYYNSDNKMSFIPKWRDQKKRDESFMETYEEAERFLNQEEFDSNADALMAASLNRFSAMPAKVTADTLNIIADVADDISGGKKNAISEWLRSMEDNSDLLDKSERQYSQVDYDSEFVNGLVVGTSKELVDMSSRALWGCVLHMPPEALSAIHSTTEAYNTLREKGIGVNDSLNKSGAVMAISEGVDIAFNELQKSSKSGTQKLIFKVLQPAVNDLTQDIWMHAQGEEPTPTMDEVANTLAVQASVEMLIKYSSKIIEKF